jgi:pyrroline-5-carboxylate reductase
VTTTTFIGGGMMGEAILSGMLAAGTDPIDIIVVERVAERTEFLLDTYGIRTAELEAGAAEADFIIVAVKPQGFDETLRAMQPHLRSDTVVISIAAGKTLGTMERLLPGTHCIRVMPNTPALVGQGMSAFSRGTLATDEELTMAMAMLATVGKTVEIPETLQDVMTSMHGSGPAFYYYVMESFIEGGVALGLDRELASTLALQTFIGSAELIKVTGSTPEQLRKNVTSPGGTTAAALAKFEELGLRDTLMAGQRACRDRGAELSQL